MGQSFKQDRDAIVALLDRALRDEERTERPLQSDRRNWLYGSAGLTEPDKHGWMAPVPPADVWVPRALVFWRMAVLTGTAVSDEQLYDPRYSLARWPAIKEAVAVYLQPKEPDAW